MAPQGLSAVDQQKSEHEAIEHNTPSDPAGVSAIALIYARSHYEDLRRKLETLHAILADHHLKAEAKDKSSKNMEKSGISPMEDCKRHVSAWIGWLYRRRSVLALLILEPGAKAARRSTEQAVWFLHDVNKQFAKKISAIKDATPLIDEEARKVIRVAHSLAQNMTIFYGNMPPQFAAALFPHQRNAVERSSCSNREVHVPDRPTFISLGAWMSCKSKEMSLQSHPVFSVRACETTGLMQLQMAVLTVTCTPSGLASIHEGLDERQKRALSAAYTLSSYALTEDQEIARMSERVNSPSDASSETPSVSTNMFLGAAITPIVARPKSKWHKMQWVRRWRTKFGVLSSSFSSSKAKTTPSTGGTDGNSCYT